MTRELPLRGRELSRCQQVEFEDRIASFERDWHLSPFPDLGKYLPQDPQLCELVRAELQAIDREFRHGAGLAALESLSAEAPVNDGRAKAGRPSENGSDPVRSDQNDNECDSLPKSRTPFRIGAECCPEARLEFSASHSTPATASGTQHVSGTATRLISNYDPPFQRHAGGLGDIWVAHEPAIGRSVAIKQLQRRWQNLARARRAFMQEVRITSLLEHPGVAPVHAVGETEDGRPCYSMRYIHGETLAESIEVYHAGGKRPVSKLRELLGHFVAVCNTIAYAHSRGVLHRDLKPANIMIGPYGQTLVIDWGLAKQFEEAGEVGSPEVATGLNSVAETRACETTVSEAEATQLDPDSERLHTALGDIIGTPAFMSPEQAAGQVDRLSPRTDVFGLGAVLFNILYGKPPFSSAQTRGSLKRTAGCKPQYPESFRTNCIAPGLAAICSKAMAEEPRQRYADAMSLASDIQNWLIGEPITARQQPLSEKLVRFARQRRTLALTTMFSVLALCVTAILAALGVQHARAEKLLATRTADVKAQAASDISSYLSRVFRTVDPIQFDDPGFSGGENYDTRRILRKMLDCGAEVIDTHLKDQPEAYSDLLTSLGQSYRGLANYERAIEMLNKGLAIRRERFGDGAVETLQTQYFLARCSQDRGDYGEAEQQYRQIIAAGARLNPAAPLLIADAKFHLAWNLFYQPLSVELPQFNPQLVNESIRLFSEVIDERESQLGPHDRSVGLAHAGLAAARMSFSEQMALARFSAIHAMEIFQRSGQESELGSFLVAYCRAEQLRNDGKSAEAEALYLQFKVTIAAQLGERHPIYIVHLWNMAGHYRKFGQFDRAEATIDELRTVATSLPNLRSAPVHLDGLCQYAEALINVNRTKAREVAAEVRRFAVERPATSQKFCDRADKIFQQLEADPTSANTLATPPLPNREVVP